MTNQLPANIRNKKTPLNLEKIGDKKIIEPTWCEKCGYAKPKDAEICPHCVKRAKERQAMELHKKNELMAKLGGLRAYTEFTEQRFLDKSKLKECDSFPNSNIYIYGNIGVGKTHLATALIRRCDNFYRLKPMQIFRKLRAFDGAAKEEAIINSLANTPLLIDDIGTEKITEFNLQILYEIIDRRYELGNTGLIITSNLNLNGLSEKLGTDRISSRLKQMCICVKLNGSDMRLKK